MVVPGDAIWTRRVTVIMRSLMCPTSLIDPGAGHGPLSAFPIARRWLPRHPERLQLYSLPTPSGVKVSILLEALEQPYEAHRVSFEGLQQLSAEFLAASPNPKIPVILDPHGPQGRPLLLCESAAILQYLAERAGRLLDAEAGVGPEQARWQTLQWLAFCTGNLRPAVSQLGYWLRLAGHRRSESAHLAQLISDMRRTLAVLERQLDGRRWITGPCWTIADIALWSWVRALVRFYDAARSIGWDDFPQVQRVLAAFEAEPAVRRGLQVPQ
ncbi:MAG: glutathione S-transferase [Pseudomonadota bacterium]